jgi:hypothetical protein
MAASGPSLAPRAGSPGRSAAASPAPLTRARSAPLARLAPAALALLPTLVGLGVGALLSGCGHPTTAQECDEILNKVVELELKKQNVHDPAVIEQRKAETRSARGAELQALCKGRKITNKAMACVRTADSFDKIDNECLR